MAIADFEQKQVDKANASGRPPVVFVHGLWLLPSSWDPWRERFEQAGYSTVAPGWPDDPETVADARQHPEILAGKSIKQVADHLADVVGRLNSKPAIVGHSFGGLMTEILAGRGLSAASVAISPAPFRGVLALPLSALRVGFLVLRNPLNIRRAVGQNYGQFRYAFANAVSEEEAKDLYERLAVAGPGKVTFQAALANVNPWTEAKVDTKRPDRGPLLIISGDQDHTVPWSIANGSYKKQKRNPGVTEIVKMTGRGHALTIDSGSGEVAQVALDFIRRYVKPAEGAD
jgi:non-heme chloroperoxidase